MAITTGSYPLQSNLATVTPKTGSHNHTCIQGHTFTCAYSSSCSLEILVGAQGFINELCPACHNYRLGKYAS
jgi:hypothetical protein